MEHNDFLETKLQHKITVAELNLLYNEDDNKDRIMPASYGKGRFRARKDMQKYITESNIEIWDKLTKDEQNMISDYL